ncbi:hypothetical protein FZ934_17415 [Rhizobium grahamii]|uniref:Capsule biosynthesis protein n=1 Tax=Rhizobium grahamii TaxID=1120045 RepID=A0A5Q0C7T9_9HYPH|nr:MULTISPECIES: hypothetical protein [Rhizobium]QFY62018.1 hypothetical protein FZ934_17415 [Rhizobium grahamii]QRM48805.1 hypothetical protein F3Y33_05480 [Rhizobium sp. BG6]
MSRIRTLIAAASARWGLDQTESRFAREATALYAPIPAPSGEEPMRILVQLSPDYQCLIKFLGAIQAEGKGHAECVGLWHQNVMSAPYCERFSMPRRLVRRLFNLLDFLKWKRLYHAIGVRSFVNLEVSPLTSLSNFRQANRIWRGLKSKEDVLAISLNGTDCGTLIYDTYLRYRVQPTVNVSDRYLRMLIVQALNAQAAIRRHLAKGRFDRLYTNYASYIQHGIPVREALRAGVEVYACGNLSQVYKKLAVDDPLHTEPHWHYVERFAGIADKHAARSQAEAVLEKRFAGGIDKATAYMKTSAYAAGAPGALSDGIEGVVFLHDFFDSPHHFRHMLFPDFDNWVRFTLDTIVREKLPLAIKAHPNQLPESAVLVEQLKRDYPTVTFLDPKLSNAIIFRSGIKCGVSVYGTVLGELAYHGIPALAGGDHPHIDFDIAITPISIEDYRQKLVGFRELKAPANAREQMLEFYYTHQIMPSDDLVVDFGALDVNRLEQNQSRALATVMSTYEPFVKARA